MGPKKSPLSVSETRAKTTPEKLPKVVASNQIEDIADGIAEIENALQAWDLRGDSAARLHPNYAHQAHRRIGV